MNKSEDPEPDGSLPRWKIVCVELKIELTGGDLGELRRQAKELVDKDGDPRIDYRFRTLNCGTATGGFVITPTQGLRNFQHNRAIRQAS
jgi:hypothetical protein